MERAVTVFIQVVNHTQSLEIGIAELKRKGYSQNDTIKVMMQVLGMNIVEADQRVRESLVWND